MAADFFSEAQDRYDQAVLRLDAIRGEWVDLGEPLLANGSMGQLIEHPLVKMLREHERLVADLGERLSKRHRGPEPKAVLGGVGKSKSATLRAVGGNAG